MTPQQRLYNLDNLYRQMGEELKALQAMLEQPAAAAPAAEQPAAPTFEQFYAKVGELVRAHPWLSQPQGPNWSPLQEMVAPYGGDPKKIPVEQYTAFISTLEQRIAAHG